ncbi:MAG: acyl-CoA synthetase [Chloroflexi bacterium]|nr:acyl-CoA synthetase [Chloroflexota bacterium]
MYIGAMAAKFPDKPAVMGGGESITYAELDARSNQLAHLFRAWGLRSGDGIAVLIGNEPRFYEFYWAAMRSGLYFTPINTHLSPGEMAYIADNCEAKVLVVSAALRDAAQQIAGQLPHVQRRVVVNDRLAGFASYPQVVGDVPAAPLAFVREGMAMLYSSGTTGKPKGVRVPLPDTPPGVGIPAGIRLAVLFGYRPEDRYLCTGPLYHAAPLGFSTTNHRIGGTVVLMSRFDAEESLRLIERERVTTSQWVPTHFVRLLHLPDEVRQRYNLSSHRMAIHAAAPCPVPVKQQMIAWWGNIIVEYYAGTEGGGTLVRADEWLARPGTVGRHWGGGKVWILDEDGQEAPAGQVGLVYFEGGENARERFEYYKDPQKTAQTYRGRLFTLGDIGYLDGDGYLFLTDRQSHMIISGGVNIYPQEIENVLVMHPAVADVAVIGVPDAEMGEAVKAVAQLREGIAPDEALAQDIIEFSRARIAHFKCPRSVDFVDQLPRTAAGKLLKRELKQKYWGPTAP